METAPRNCRFLSLVVVELVLNHSIPIARLSSGLAWGSWELLPLYGCEIGQQRASQSQSLLQRGPYSGWGWSRHSIAFNRMRGPLRSLHQGCCRWGESLESLKAPDSLESLEDGRTSLGLGESGGISMISRIKTLESLENEQFWNDLFFKGPVSRLHFWWPEEGVITKGVLPQEESLKSLKFSINSLERTFRPPKKKELASPPHPRTKQAPSRRQAPPPSPPSTFNKTRLPPPRT